MRWTFAVLMLTTSTALHAQARASDVKPAASDAARAIDLGNAFLAKDAAAWKTAHNCASCHHAGLVVWAYESSKQHGYRIDETQLAELKKWLVEAGDGKTALPRPDKTPKAINSKALYFALALRQVPQPSEEVEAAIKRLSATIAADRNDDGSWSAWPESRPPMLGPSNENVTLQAALAMQSTADGDDTAKAAYQKTVDWLVKTPTDGDAQSLALRTALWAQLKRPQEEIKQLAQQVRERQNTDGGWSQTKEMKSDAWATGQALYALACSGATADDATVKNGIAFLVKAQQSDGSWPMESRPSKPGGGPAKTLVPIIGAGSAWAVIGLTQHVSPPKPQAK